MAKKPQPVQNQAKTNVSQVSTNSSETIYYIFLGIILTAISLLRYKLVGIPLERDEGEYAYMGSRILDGVLPYKDAYNMKLPGTYFMYAFIMLLFGKSYTAIHVGLLLMNAGTMTLLFFGLKKLISPIAGLGAALTFGIMAISVNMLGFAAHATHFATFYVALATFFWSKYTEKEQFKWILFTGIAFGTAFLMKQQVVFFLVFGGIVLLLHHGLKKPIEVSKTVMHTLLYAAGVFLPYLFIVLIMFLGGNFDTFWFWTVQYASKYASGVDWEQGKMLLGMTFKPIWTEFMWIWLLALAGLVCLWVSKYTLQQKIFITLFALMGIASVCPGFYFRQHYFIVVLPAVGLLVGVALDTFSKLLKIQSLRFIPLIVLMLLSIGVVANGKFYFFKNKPMQLCKMIYGTNPFVEAVEIADYINKNSSDTAQIAVLGSEPEIMVYANRKSATGHIYTYGLMEIHDYNKKMQSEMIAEIEKAKPEFLVYCNVRTSWLVQQGSPMDIFDWYGKYAAENYNLVGLVDVAPQGQSNYYFDNQANRQPQSQEFVLIYKRK